MHLLFGSCIDRTSSSCEELASTRMLIFDSGHYDLLYKAEDIAQMAIPALSNPEIQLVSNTPTFSASATTAYSQTTDLDVLGDIPGFTMGMPQSFGCLPYHPPSESLRSSPQKTISPATSTKEGLSPSSQATSPASTEQRPPEPKPQPMERRFLYTNEQLDFDLHHAKARASTEPQPTNFTRE